jgi:hypothetical protein
MLTRGYVMSAPYPNALGEWRIFLLKLFSNLKGLVWVRCPLNKQGIFFEIGVLL